MSPRRYVLAACAGALLLSLPGAHAQIRSLTPRPVAPAAGATRAPAAGPLPASPIIVSVRPGGCIAPGVRLYVQARNFSASDGLAIVGNGAHVDLQIGPDMMSVVALVPANAALSPGSGYVLGIEKADHSGWLSNVVSLSVCAATAATGPVAPATVDRGGGVSAPDSDGNALPPVASQPGLPSGGSLLGEALPPPPGDTQAPGTVKEDVTVEPAEVVVVSATMQDALQIQQQVQSLGMGIKRRAALGNLGLVVSVFRVPKELGVANALAQLRRAMPDVRLDANHRYRLQLGSEAAYGAKLVAWPSQRCAAGARLGLIDTGVDLRHPALASQAVVLKSFLPAGVTPARPDHGTAIASLLVGGEGIGLMPGASLRAAAVFRLRGKDEADTTTELVVRALDWLVGEKVSVINLSFGGDRNQLLETAIARVEQRGVEVLAAAGNGGADAAPVYPAAQPGVVAVTAVDAKLALYPRANRGAYVAYAAPGVDVWAAAPGASGRYVTGTSYAVPFAVAIFAAAKAEQPGASWTVLENQLRSRAKDLGTPGRDDVFGWGLIQALGGCGGDAR